MMSTKTGKDGGPNKLQVKPVPVLNQLEAGVLDTMGSPELSSIERVSILEKQLADGNPLHSTAIGEDLHTAQEREREGEEEKRESGGEGEEREREGEEKGGRKEKRAEGKKKRRMEGKRKEKRETEGGRTGTPYVQRTRQMRWGVAQKEREKDGEKEKKSVGGKTKGRPGKERLKERKKSTIEEEVGESEGEGPDPSPAQKRRRPTLLSEELTDNGIKPPAGKMAAQRMEEKARDGGKGRVRARSGKERVSRAESEGEESESDPTQLRYPIISSEEITDEDTSWKPSQKKARAYSRGIIRKSSSDRSKTRKSSSSGPRTKKSSSDKLKSRKTSSDRSKHRKSAGEGGSQKEQTRKSLSGSSASGSAEAEPTNREQQQKRGRGQKGTKSQSELEVVLDAFLNFCDQYRESVESKAVRQAIDSLSSSVDEQLNQKITAAKDLKVLRRENIKMAAQIQKTRQSLLQAKYEQLRKERQLRLLEEEEASLEQRLADLRRGPAFLRGITELNRRYLEHRNTHPTEIEEYGASSLPALLLETRYILGAEVQLRNINNRLAERLKTGE